MDEQTKMTKEEAGELHLLIERAEHNALALQVAQETKNQADRALSKWIFEHTGHK